MYVTIVSFSFVCQIFRLGDLTDNSRDFAPVLTTLQELYRTAESQPLDYL